MIDEIKMLINWLDEYPDIKKIRAQVAFDNKRGVVVVNNNQLSKKYISLKLFRLIFPKTTPCGFVALPLQHSEVYSALTVMYRRLTIDIIIETL